MTRNDVIEEAIFSCMKELYSWVQPSTTWEDFVEENKIYSKIYKEHEQYRKAYYDRKKYPEVWEKVKSQYEVLEWDPSKSYKECIGPAPFEFYYLPKDIMKDICDSYIHAYKIDNQQELLDTIEVLKNYCKEPIVDKYIDDWTDEEGNHHPGYKSYDHPDNLEKQLTDLIPDSGFDKSAIAESIQSKFFKFLDMAGKFFNWNRDLNTFNCSVYLGSSPNTNKESVINNWKKYRNQDIEIDEEQIKKEYYGEEDYC